MSAVAPTLDFAPLYLKKDEERRLRAGHVWVYSNEVDVQRSPLKDLTPGQPVVLLATTGKTLGTGYANPHSLICARLVSRDAQHPFGPSLLVHRLKVALSLRQRLFATPFYRLVYGEADQLPGLVVDRYGDVLAVQLTTAGMEQQKDGLLGALIKVLRPKAVVWRNDSSVRALEGLESYVAVEESLDPVAPLILEEEGLRFVVDPVHGQKTGWFYDQRDNRTRFRRHVKGRVLDAFSYTGAWGITAAASGADEVLCVDTSQSALELAAQSADLNGVAAKLQLAAGDGLTTLKNLRQDNQRFDVVVVDPPAFIKRKKDWKAGAIAYRRLFEAAMRLLSRDGLLVACSCSQHFGRDDLHATLLQAARHLDRHLMVVERGHQAADHPLHPAIPETDYLKASFCRTLPA